MDKFNTGQQKSIGLKQKRISRYILVCILTAISVVTLSAHYGYDPDARIPRFRLETAEGDDAIGQSIQITGNYYIGATGHFIKVFPEGTEFKDRLPLDTFMQGLSFRGYRAGFEGLTDDFPSFMRGKSYGEFDQTQEWLAYVELSNAKGRTRIKLSLLNKAAGKSTVHYLEAGGWPKNENILLEDVQVEDKNIHFLLRRWKPDSAGYSTNSQLTDYVVDLSSGNILNEREIAIPGTEVSSQSHQIRLVKDWSGDTASPYTLIISSNAEPEKRSTEKLPQNADLRPVRSYDLFAYRYADGKLEALNDLWPNTVEDAGNANYFLNGDDLYAIRGDAGRKNSTFSTFIDVKGINLARHAHFTAYSIGASELGSQTMGSPVLFKNGLIHVILNQDSRPMVAVIDAVTGKLVYKGKVVLEKSANDEEKVFNKTRLDTLEIRS
ncbi:hypothetical protein [Cohnella sp. JJ-181]|uniref:hypothetical protein n=1 Tax=Cohnella rhizoplanae TaxID=2974897 RepID=UPI0022FFA4C2|nr:hypothetical protein [Cohnella sp. JJ-181]CAI6031796.1 hypothetical protein COHCIP112018_00732 [Cohnella sp. JJ-181]